MKKKTVLLSLMLVMTLGTVGKVPVIAAETIPQETAEAEDAVLSADKDQKDSDTDSVLEKTAEEAPDRDPEEVPSQDPEDAPAQDPEETPDQMILEEDPANNTEFEQTLEGQQITDETVVEPVYNTVIYTEAETFQSTVPSYSWKQNNGKWYCIDAYGNLMTGITKVGGLTYLLDVNTGAMKTNQWYQIGSSWYHSDRYGRLLTGWQNFGSSWYYLDPENDGAMARNRFIIAGNGQYYVDGYGVMQVNKVVEVDGKLYAFNSYGLMLNGGWYQVGGSWCYADTDGVLRTGIQEINGIKYLLDSKTGALQTNRWYQNDSEWYYFDSYGRKQTGGWLKSGDSWYYLDPENGGAMVRNSFIGSGDVKYYVNSYGVMQVNKIVQINGKLYAFDGYGVMQNSGWCKVGGKWCFADEDGVLVTGILKINGTKYLLDSKTGTMMANLWYWNGSDWYFFDKYGRMLTGWQEIGNKWYYLDPDNGGAMATGLIQVGDSLYYLNSDGAMQTYTTVFVNGIKYYIDGYGRATNRATKPDGKYYRADIVALAQSLVGIKEGGSAHHMIVDTYNEEADPLPRGYTVRYSDAWCAVFTSYLAIECGYTDIIPVECGCPQWISLAKDMESWVETDSYTPLPGDFILYDWEDSGSGDNKGNPDHIGVVEQVAGGVMSVIEGNYKDMVKRREVAVNGTYIRGFVVPDYTE